jgi:hypothetical protein
MFRPKLSTLFLIGAAAVAGAMAPRLAAGFGSERAQMSERGEAHMAYRDHGRERGPRPPAEDGDRPDRRERPAHDNHWSRRSEPRDGGPGEEGRGSCHP